MSRKQFVCAANLGFPVRPCGFIHFFHSFDLQSGNLHHISFIHHGPCYCSKTKAWHWDTVQCMWKTDLRHHHDMRSISIVEAGIWSAQGVTFWMMDRRAVYWWPLHDRICPQPCFRNSRWSQSTTVWSQGISEMKFICTLSNSLWKNYLDYLDCIDHL